AHPARTAAARRNTATDRDQVTKDTLASGEPGVPARRIHLVRRVPIYNSEMRVTLFGSSGLLGQELGQALKAEQLTALSSKDADLRDHSRIREVIRDSRPDWILLSAAYT